MNDDDDSRLSRGPVDRGGWCGVVIGCRGKFLSANPPWWPKI